jgi:hypothetical protein
MTISSSPQIVNPVTLDTIRRRPFVELWSDLYDSAATTTTDRLPASYVAEWSTFVLELSSLKTTATTSTTDSSQDNEHERTARWTWSRIPDASYDDRIKEGTDSGTTTNEMTASSPFVNPDTLWHALDLQPLKMSAAVGLHVRHGRVRHVMPALDLYFHDSSKDGDATRDHSQRQRRIHCNRGFNSVPRAHAWLDFGAYLASSSMQDIACRLETRSPSSIIDEAKDDWTTLQVLPLVSEMISLALEALATDAPASMGQDSAVVHVVLVSNNHTATSNPCPVRTNSQVRVVLEHGVVHDDNIDTAQEARPVAMVGGLLHASTAAGSESDHLPDCYAPLYTNLAHRRRAFSQRQRGPLQVPRPRGNCVCVVLGLVLFLQRTTGKVGHSLEACLRFNATSENGTGSIRRRATKDSASVHRLEFGIREAESINGICCPVHIAT